METVAMKVKHWLRPIRKRKEEREYIKMMFNLEEIDVKCNWTLILSIIKYTSGVSIYISSCVLCKWMLLLLVKVGKCKSVFGFHRRDCSASSSKRKWRRFVFGWRWSLNSIDSWPTTARSPSINFSRVNDQLVFDNSLGAREEKREDIRSLVEQEKKENDSTLWRCRASIPVPLACKASALPSELHPHIEQIRRIISSSRRGIHTHTYGDHCRLIFDEQMCGPDVSQKRRKLINVHYFSARRQVSMKFN